MRWEMAGWLTFIVSAIFFIAASIRAGDMTGLAGSILFLIACFFFLVPYLKRR